VATGGPGAVPLERYFVTDQSGNEYIMHAAGVEQSEVAQRFEYAVLPPGWAKSVRRLKKDLILQPAAGAHGTFHDLVFRDSADNTDHQARWSHQWERSRRSRCACVAGPGCTPIRRRAIRSART
jgi:hypothetical protein